MLNTSLIHYAPYKYIGVEYALVYVIELPKSCTYFDSKSGAKILLVREEGQDLLHSWLSKKHAEEVAKFATKDEILELRHKLEMKELENKSYLEKIELLQKRAEEDKERMDRILKSLDQLLII